MTEADAAVPQVDLRVVIEVEGEWELRSRL